MRNKIVAANWKMNTTIEEGIKLAIAVCDNIKVESEPGKKGIICPPFTHLAHLAEILKKYPHLSLGAQNCHIAQSGAFTGEVSAAMLASAGVAYVIAGHSERRQLFGESDNEIATKVQKILEAGLTPIFCCGELLESRMAGTHFEIVNNQVSAGIMHLPVDALQKVIIAYEPVWAIGTGEVATPQQAQDMHASIRRLIRQTHGDTVANNVSILYGGSVKPGNAESLFSQPDVDGGLIGGASLDAEAFAKIFHSF